MQVLLQDSLSSCLNRGVRKACRSWTLCLALGLVLAPGALPLKALPDEPGGPRVIASGKASGGYAAFPDICRTKEGDLLCVFYSGYGHVSKANETWPKGGRVMSVRSTDGGKTWSAPGLVADTVHDDRDPHIALLRDGTLLCNWFVAVTPGQPLPGNPPIALFLCRSNDSGKTWSTPERIELEGKIWYASSAPVRELKDGTLILGLYTEDEKAGLAYGASVRSRDGGKTWKGLATIGEGAGVFLDAETDIVELKDGTLLAALRSSRTTLHFARSTDGGEKWSPVSSAGFPGHSPHFLRHSSGAILLTHRLPATALHWSTDDGKTWQGPLQIDDVGGAYPSTVELPDGLVVCVYYEEGDGSSIRAARLRVRPEAVVVEKS